MKIIPAFLICTLSMVILLTGCTKISRVTIYNHMSSDKSVQLTVSGDSRKIGVVRKNGSLTHILKLYKKQLPAKCTYSAGAGSSVSFDVTEGSSDTFTFHIMEDGQMRGQIQTPQ